MPDEITGEGRVFVFGEPDELKAALGAARAVADLEALEEVTFISRTPDDLPNGEPVCDFCRATPVEWTYPCDSFMLPELDWQSVGDWAACERCGELIEADDLDGLFARWFSRFSEEDRAEAAADERKRRALELYQRTMHTAFMAHRWGERRRYDPEEGRTMPEAIRVLPRDERGLPIPYAQLRLDGRPDFRSLDAERAARCVNERLCGICGRSLDYWIAFIGGPSCRTNRLFKDPAMHPECAEYAARACPFIAGSKTKYSTRPLPEGEGLAVHVDPNMADHERRPVDMFTFTTRRYRPVRKHGETYIEASPWVNVKRIDPLR